MFAENNGLPVQLYRALTDPYYTREVDDYFDSLPAETREKYRDKHFSITTLLRPPRMVELWRRHGRGIVIDPATRLPSLFGHSVHELLRIHSAGLEVEKRSGVIMGGHLLHGQVDTYDPATGEVSDWKVTKGYGVAHGVKPEHVAQLNLNAWLLRRNGTTVTSLTLVYIIRDHDKRKVKEGGTYPASDVVTQPVEMWPDSQCHRYLWGRLMEHIAAREAEDEALQECSDEERWAKPPVFAVMKDGNSTASYVTHARLDAERWLDEKLAALEAAHDERETKRIAGLKNPEKATRKPFSPPGFTVEERKGDAMVRCSYCDVAPVCLQRMAMLENMNTGTTTGNETGTDE